MKDKADYLHNTSLGKNALKINNIKRKEKTEKLYYSDIKKSLIQDTIMKIKIKAKEWEDIYDTITRKWLKFKNVEMCTHVYNTHKYVTNTYTTYRQKTK